MIHWFNIPDYEGYMVSKDGSVKSLARTAIRKESRGLIRQPVYEKILHGNVDSFGYISYNLNGALVRGHVIVAKAFLGYKPDKKSGLVVDHINRKKSDNRLCNLRVVSHRENCNNKSGNYTSKFAGVSWCISRNKWVSSVKHNNKSKFLGRYDLEEDAAKAYIKFIEENREESYEKGWLIKRSTKD